MPADISAAAARRRAAWRLIGGLARDVRPELLRGIIGGVTWQAAGALAPLVVARIVDQGVIDGSRSALWQWSLVLVALAIAEAFASRTRHKNAVTAFARTGATVRQRLLERVQRLDATFHDATPAGTLLARATSDAEHLAVLLDHIPHTCGFLMSVVIVTALLATVDAVVAAVVVGSLALLAVVVWRMASPQRVRAAALQAAISTATVTVEETIAGYPVIKGLGAERARGARIGAAAAAVQRRGVHANRLEAVLEALLELLPALTLGAALWIGGHRAIDGRLTVGELLATLAYVSFLIWPMRVLGERVGTLQKGIASAERLVDIYDARRAVAEPAAPRPLPSGIGGLPVALEQVRFGYGDGPPVLAGLSLRVGAGERLAVVGGTGSGKSTLLQLLARDYDVDAGRVTVGDVDVRDVVLAELRRSVALAGHDPVLFAGTVHDNIAFADPLASRERVAEAARLAGAEEFVRRLPRGYDTVVGEHGMTLSGGQRQRLALARALLAEPAVLLLDDATSALDATTEALVVAALTEERRQQTLLVVTHRPATLQLADTVVLLDGGRIAAQGTHRGLLESNARYREVLAHRHADVDLLDAGHDDAGDEEVAAP